MSNTILYLAPYCITESHIYADFGVECLQGTSAAGSGVCHLIVESTLHRIDLVINNGEDRIGCPLNTMLRTFHEHEQDKFNWFGGLFTDFGQSVDRSCPKL